MTTFEKWYLFCSALAALATCVTAIIVSVAARLALRQVTEASRARQFEATLAVLSHISSPELRNARRLLNSHHAEIATKLDSNPKIAWKDLDNFFKEISDHRVDLNCFQSYASSLENVSILVLHDLAPDEVIDMYFGHMALKAWNRLEPFIMFMRGHFASTDYLQHFEMLTELLKKNGLHVPSLPRKNRISQRTSGRLKRELLNEKRRNRQTALTSLS